MGIFSSIIDKIFHHANAGATGAATGSAQASTAPAATSPSSDSAAPSSAPSGATSSGTQPLKNIDVEAVLAKRAESKGGGGNWRTSIVDLLKLLDLDSSLGARKTLASELGVHEGADGSAEQNIALQRAVMAKLAENGGNVPDSLRR